VQQCDIIAKERRDAQAYAEQPQRAEEIEEWLDGQVWDDLTIEGE
jgi:hypothetical protein